jgi:hypothetical protein
MNKLQMTEMLRGHHPHITSKQSEMYIKYAADRIAEETNLCKVTELYNSVAGQRYYSVPRDTIRITRVWFNDVLIPKLIGEPIIDDDEFTDDADNADTPLSTPVSKASNKRFWFFRNTDMTDTSGATSSEEGNAGGALKIGYSRSIAIVEKVTNAVTRDGRTSDYQSCSISGTTNLRVERIRYPRDFSNEIPGTQSATRDATEEETLSPLQDIPEEFHHTLLDGAIAIGYKYPPNINFDFYGAFLADFEKGIKKIKRFERTKTGTGFIRPHDF